MKSVTEEGDDKDSDIYPISLINQDLTKPKIMTMASFMIDGHCRVVHLAGVRA